MLQNHISPYTVGKYKKIFIEILYYRMNLHIFVNHSVFGTMICF